MGKVIMGGVSKGMTEPLPGIGISLNDASWDDISAVSAAGLASSYWSVGDRKAVEINGTVGVGEVSGTYYVYIIGFDHNGATGIDFGTFKTAATDGVDVGLHDQNYIVRPTDGTKYYNINHWGEYNYGGWKGCDMRYDLLGSTDIEPSDYGTAVTSSRVGYDATETCATNPVPNTLMAALPADLRAVMKPMIIYTDNTGNGNNSEAGISTSVDYLPLLAEHEVTGSREYCNQYERNHQTQYAYYSAGNSKVKKCHYGNMNATGWWTRSPFYYGTVNFIDVNNQGGLRYDSAAHREALAPIFRV